MLLRRLWVLGLLVMAGCAADQAVDDSRVFRWNMHAGVTSLDPAFANNQTNIWACEQLYNGLLQLDDSLQPVAAIARGYEVSDSGRVYTFYLRQDVYFQDDELFEDGEGRRVTAGDFVYSLNRIIDPAVASPGAWIFADKVYIDSAGRGSFYALNDSTLQIKLRKAFPPFAGLLAMHYCSVVPREVVAHYGKDFRKHPVGTGAFMIQQWHENEKLILVKNPNYFERRDGERLPYLDAVYIGFLPERQNEFMSFLQGDLDIVSGLDRSFKDQLLTRQGNLRDEFDGKFRMEKIPFLNTEYLGIQLDTAFEQFAGSPLRERQIRQAINYGFDRRKMLKYLRNNIGKPGSYGFVPSGLPAFDTASVPAYTYRPDHARKLLAEAGYPNGEGLPVIKLYTNPTYLDLCLYIRNELKAIGIDLKIEVNAPSTHREWMRTFKIDFFRASWIADYPDAENYLALFYSKNHSPGGPNYTHFSSARYDSLYEQSLQATDRRERLRLYREMGRIVQREAPVIVLYYDEVVRLVQNDVKGFGRNAINLIRLKGVRKES